jgi:hypothetical protein
MSTLVHNQNIMNERVGHDGDVKLRVLLLADVRPDGLDFFGRRLAGTMLDHIHALSRGSRHHVYCLNSRGWTASEAIEFDTFDVLVIHYSISVIDNAYLSPAFRERIRTFPGLKVIFIQDEYRRVNAYVDAIIDLGISVLFTCVPEISIDVVYRRLRDRGVKIIPTLTGFVSDELALRPRRSLRERPLDVVYRGRPVPYELGDLGYEKVEIAQRFIDEAQRHGLAVDVDWREEARIYGDRWVDFMSSGRATLGTESGASIVDFDGSIASSVEAYGRRHPGAQYREVADAVLKPHEGNILINTISPRAFEAICLGTALVLFPGQYSGILQPWRHYVPLAKNFSNIEEVADCLTDLPFLERLTQTAFDEIVNPGTYSYSAFTKKVDDALAEFWLDHEGAARIETSVGWFDADTWRRTLNNRVARLTGDPAPRLEADPAPDELLSSEQPEGVLTPEKPPIGAAQRIARWLLPHTVYGALRPLVHRDFRAVTNAINTVTNALNSIADFYAKVSTGIGVQWHQLKIRRRFARQRARRALRQIVHKVCLTIFRLSKDKICARRSQVFKVVSNSAVFGGNPALRHPMLALDRESPDSTGPQLSSIATIAPSD